MEKSGRHPVAIAVGLIVAGLAALVVANWVLDADFSNAGPDPDWYKGLTAISALGAIVVLALRHGPIQRLAWTFAATALAVTTLGVIGFIAQYESGYPGRQTLLTAVGGLAVTVGAVLLSLAPSGRWRRPALASALFSLVALPLVPLVASPLLIGTPDWRLAVTTTASASAAPAVPDTVSKVAWSTEVDGEIRDVVAGGRGAVAMVNDGVIGVDGTTGAIQWSRRRSGAYSRQLDASPDGRTVALQIAAQHGNQVQLEVLDAFTGQVRFSVRKPQEPTWVDDFHTQMTNVSYVVFTEDRTVYSGYSLADGRKLWDFPVSGECRVIGRKADQFTVADAILLPMVCDENEFRYVSVDAANGAQRWQYSARFLEKFDRNRFLVEASPDRALVTFWFQAVGPYRRALLDTATGKVLAELPIEPVNHGLGLATQPDLGKTLVDVRTGRTVVGDGPALDCARAVETVVLSGAAVCLNDGSRQDTAKVSADGSVELAVVRFADPSIMPIQVRLRGPLSAAGGHERVHWLPVPGAVVVYSEPSPEPGARYSLAGLR